jgi:hypothetical protein
MIVSPDKGIFFVATAVMCSAALYAAELSSPNQDPLRRIFIGVPNQLTLPPDFPEATSVSVGADECGPAGANPAFQDGTFRSASIAPACVAKEKAAPATIVLPGPLTGVSAAGQERVAPASLSTAVQAH